MIIEDRTIRQKLLLEHLPLVRSLCRRFAYSREPLEDLIQTGTIGLLNAIDKYDPGRGVPFIGFAVPVIVGEIKNFLRDHGSAIKLPRKLQRHKRQVAKAIELLTKSLGREPTIKEIGEAAGISEEELYDTFESEAYCKPLSLEGGYHQNGTTPESASDLRIDVGNEDPQFEEMTTSVDVANAVDDLNKREKIIIRLKFYDGLSQANIAELLGVSQMHVSRLQRNALAKLRLTLVV